MHADTHVGEVFNRWQRNWIHPFSVLIGRFSSFLLRSHGSGCMSQSLKNNSLLPELFWAAVLVGRARHAKPER
jgi:hypothetical protein